MLKHAPNDTPGFFYFFRRTPQTVTSSSTRVAHDVMHVAVQALKPTAKKKT
jgi:hypothetical protein